MTYIASAVPNITGEVGATDIICYGLVLSVLSLFWFSVGLFMGLVLKVSM
jgi:hypothetical protein